MMKKMNGRYNEQRGFSPLSDHLNPWLISSADSNHRGTNYILPKQKFMLCTESVLSPCRASWWIGGGHEASGGRGGRFSALQVEIRQWRENKAGLAHVGVSTRERGEKATSSSYASPPI